MHIHCEPVGRKWRAQDRWSYSMASCSGLWSVDGQILMCSCCVSDWSSCVWSPHYINMSRISDKHRGKPRCGLVVAFPNAVNVHYL